MSEKSTISDDYKEIDTSSVTSSKTEQASEVNSQTNDINESRSHKNEPVTDKIFGKISGSIKEIGKEGKNTIKKTIPFGDQQDNNNGVKSIMLGLFALIGFIILVYSIFIGIVGEPLASVADTVFIAALIGSFILVATLISHLYIKR